MPKGDFMSPKAIANRIKAKGLQKLRWYCQMCNKQCRDENGFKCHTMTEGHIRMMALFADSADKYMNNFSNQFERTFLALLARRYGERRVLANSVYNEYIQDKQHLHMNSTMWLTLTDFVKHLGRTGKCVIDETERGWFIQYINRDPDAVKRQQAAAAREAQEMDDEARHEADIEAMVAAAHTLEETVGSSAAGAGTRAFEEFKRSDDGDHAKVKISLGGNKLKHTSAAAVGFEDDDAPPATNHVGTDTIAPPADMLPSTASSLPAAVGMKRGRAEMSGYGKSALDAIINEEAAKRKVLAAVASSVDEPKVAPPVSRPIRSDHWIMPGIIVKIMNKSVGGGRFYKLKAEIVEVQDKYVAVVEVLDTKEMLKIDQSDLETVIPAVGGRVVFVNGTYTSQTAEVLSINVEKYCVSVKLLSGKNAGAVVDGVEYEDVCKLASQ